VANILQYLAQPMAPDILGAFDRGRAQAALARRERFADQQLKEQIESGNRFRQLAGEAYSAAPEQRQQILSQAAAIDPRGAMALESQFAARDKTQHELMMERMGITASALVNAPEQMRPMLYKAMLPELRKFVPNAPEEYDPGMIPVAQQFLSVSRGAASQPANVQEWEYYSRLPEDQKRAYLQMKRADPTFKMGDVTMLGDPIRGTARPFTEEPGQTQADIQRTISQQAAEGVAMQENVKAASKLADDSFKRLESVRANIANYDEAIRLIDEGAQTGVIASRLPSVRQASIALDNLQGRLGLDVIGNTTFGALSEAELRFALSTALPQNMRPQELKVWLQQKRDAQEKLAAYLEQAAIFLGTPGNTVKDWIELQRARQRGTQQPPVTRSAGEPVRVNSPQERDALPPGTQYIAPDGSIRVKR
jgi:hypothetical protein